VIDKAAVETEARQWNAITTRLAENYARMRANQVVIAAPAPAEVMAALKAAASPAIDKWSAEAGPEGQAVLKAFRAR
jgi:TRAP-type transport system periplasmic protein